MPDHKPFSGFEVVEDLPTGDQRRVFEVGISETTDSLSRNEFVVWMLCGCRTFEQKNFKRGTEPADVEAWVGSILEDHKKECPLGS